MLPLNEPEFPPSREFLSSLQQGMALLGRLRDLYLNDATEQAESALAGARILPVDTVEPLDGVMPTIRALDAQTRLLRIRLRNRISIVDEQWNELARMALAIRAARFIDDSVADRVSMFKGNTARAMFVLPLLLRAAHLETLGLEDRIVVERLARRYAHRVGFRVDKGGKLRSNPHGPSVAMDEHYAVRLDTHRLQAELARRSSQLVRGHEFNARWPRGVTQSSMKRLLTTLALVWGPTVLLPKPSRIGPVSFTTLFGLPCELPGVQSRAALPYDDPVNEGSTTIRLTRKRQQSRPVPPPLLVYAEPLICDSWTPGASFIEASLERSEITSLNQHCLVVMRPDSADCPAPLALADADCLWLGRLMGMAAQIDLQRARYARQTLTVRVWPFPARWVGLRLSADSAFEDVLYLKGVEGSLDEHSVFLRPGSWSEKYVSTLCLPEGDIPVRFGNLIERGFRFDHVRLRIEQR